MNVMSTRSTISIKRKDGTTTSIYCHFDGYIEGVGVTLQLAYNTADKVEALLQLGNLSSLGYYVAPDNSEEHSFDNPQTNVCVAYHRDRGEEYHQSAGVNEFNYTFDEEECVWYVEEECYFNSYASKALCLDFFPCLKKTLLLDAIMQTNIDKHWGDDEFATAKNVKEVCKQKALEARKQIIERKMAEDNAYYNVYYD